MRHNRMYLSPEPEFGVFEDVEEQMVVVQVEKRYSEKNQKQRKSRPQKS